MDYAEICRENGRDYWGGSLDRKTRREEGIAAVVDTIGRCTIIGISANMVLWEAVDIGYRWITREECRRYLEAAVKRGLLVKRWSPNRRRGVSYVLAVRVDDGCGDDRYSHQSRLKMNRGDIVRIIARRTA